MKVLAANYSNGGARLTQVPARFKTVVGVSYTIALKFEHGRPTRSRIDGTEQMMYTLTTGETAYFPMNVGEAIESLTLAPGQPFTICHHGGGNWDVERVAPELPPPRRPRIRLRLPPLRGKSQPPTRTPIIAHPWATPRPNPPPSWSTRSRRRSRPRRAPRSMPRRSATRSASTPT